MNVDVNINILDMLFILDGLKITLILCLSSIIIGAIIGFFIGIMRTSRFRILKGTSWFYIYLIRGTPLLMQLFLIYYGLPILMGYSPKAFTIAIMGLSIYAGAYLGEIIKAGIQSIDNGQKEAAIALGMTRTQTFLHIVFPQALKVIVPVAAGFFIALVKDSSLVSAIGFMELTRSSKLVIARTFQPFTIYLLVAVVYFLICYPLSKLSTYVERRLSVSYAK